MEYGKRKIMESWRLKMRYQLNQEQQDLESAFILDASIEDIKTNKEAKKLYKYISKRKKYIKLIEFLIKKECL